MTCVDSRMLPSRYTQTNAGDMYICMYYSNIYLNNYINFHVCLSIHSSVRSSMCNVWPSDIVEIQNGPSAQAGWDTSWMHWGVILDTARMHRGAILAVKGSLIWGTILALDTIGWSDVMCLKTSSISCGRITECHLQNCLVCVKSEKYSFWGNSQSPGVHEARSN